MNIGKKRKKKKKKVILTRNDIVTLANDLANNIKGETQGGMEFLLYKLIKEKHGVDFFAEERREAEEEAALEKSN